jgi:hypothetical protein
MTRGLEHFYGGVFFVVAHCFSVFTLPWALDWRSERFRDFGRSARFVFRPG